MARSTVCLAVLAAVTVAVALTSGGLRAHADDSANGKSSETQGAGVQVALVDIGHVFKSHEGFKQKMEQMKKELVEVEGRFRLKEAQTKVFEDRLKTLDNRSEEYLDLEEKITTERSARQGEMAREKRRFMRQETAIYAQIYSEVQDAVEDYAREHGIRLVMRFNSEPINESDSNSVMKGVNRNVVFQDGLDITAEIVQRLNANDIEPRDE